MVGDAQDDGTAATLSALRWWRDAGVDMLVDEQPRDWLAAARPPVPAAAPPALALPAADTLPDTLPALAQWLADPATFAPLGPRRFAATGDPAGALMLVTDMPEREDRAALMEGAAGRLLEAMLGAIGRDRASVYLAPLAPGRPASGRIDRALCPPLADALRRHVALARPRLVLLLGDLPATTLLDRPLAAARGRLHALNHDGGTVRALATFHPRFLLEHPACKADAWADLRLLLEEFGR